ncbi:MAG TPA: 2-phospho-L-lactate guanylyltransferase [Candidatus Udaeobacter sp.]|nr:2-phospho-L-lactate guanylyltransferase [Candidatus Udaeobacter sp.]
MKVTALLPVKGFRNAKQRLGRLLGGAERELLAEAMFRDVLRQVVRARWLAETYVVTGDDKVSNIAFALGAKVIREPAEKGETGAVDFARSQLKEDGHRAVLIIPGDMPLVRAEDIEEVLAQMPDSETASFALLVPSHDRMGTNALLLAPPDIIKLRFGFDSFSYHITQVAARGLPIRFIENTRIALDIDEPKDLERFLAYAEDNESFQLAHRLLSDRQSEQKRRCGGL